MRDLVGDRCYCKRSNQPMPAATFFCCCCCFCLGDGVIAIGLSAGTDVLMMAAFGFFLFRFLLFFLLVLRGCLVGLGFGSVVFGFVAACCSGAAGTCSSSSSSSEPSASGSSVSSSSSAAS